MLYEKNIFALVLLSVNVRRETQAALISVDFTIALDSTEGWITCRSFLSFWPNFGVNFSLCVLIENQGRIVSSQANLGLMHSFSLQAH